MAIKNITQSLRHFQKRTKDTLTTSPPATSLSPPKVTPATNQDTLMHGIGPYSFQYPLGSGKFSQVVLAKHYNGLQVAIKMIDKQAHDYRVMSRLVREIDLMQALHHDNIVKLYETFETCDTLFLVMEYIPGLNLDEYLNKMGGSLGEEEARDIFRQLVLAVHYCHSQSIVHRDLKTPNILVTPTGRIKLADFGLGNKFGRQRLKTICGSMLYYSPEIISGQKYHGPEVDCWCLGIVLFRMTAGCEPFSRAHTVGELKRDVCSANIVIPPHLSPALQTTLRKCLDVDRRKRSSIRQALENDPWLTDFGRLKCPMEEIPAALSLDPPYSREENEPTDPSSSSSTTNASSSLQHTLIYHPMNPSTYFTAPSSGTTRHFSYRHQHIEHLRTDLLYSIRTTLHELGIRPTERWETLSVRLAMHAHSFKLSNVMHRLTKDRVFYCFLHTAPCPPSDTVSSDSTSSPVLPSMYDTNHSLSTRHHFISLLQKVFQLMGITYLQDKQGSTKRLSLPPFSHLTSSATLSFFTRPKLETQPTKPPKQKEGVVQFTIQLEIQKSSLVGYVYAIRFSKKQGSTAVFKMASGWVARVMGLH
ncbi:kinase-like domain-containing protein [Spinellus fusiger]|nr:kinase-like domain-containing protein [Spinellus fusiger]